MVRLSFEAKLLPQLMEGEISCIVQVWLMAAGLGNGVCGGWRISHGLDGSAESFSLFWELE